MKKVLSIVFIVFLLLTSCICLVSCDVGTKGLEYKLSEDESYYIVTGIGDATDTDIVIPQKYNKLPVKAIADCAFYYGELTSVVIPDSVTTIGERAFEVCESLTTVTIGNGVEDIPYQAFRYCEALTSVTIGNNVTSIGAEAFFNCNSLTNIMFAEDSKLQIIGDRAFRYCTSLVSISIPDSISSIGSDSFYQCNSLTYNEYNNCLYLGNKKHPYLVLLYDNDKSRTELELHEDTKAVNSMVFSDHTSLEDLTMHGNVASIGYSAFENCNSLANVYYTGTLADWCKISFYNEYSSPMNETTSFFMLDENNEYHEVTNFVIPDGVTSISSWAFRNFAKMTSIYIPKSVTSIGGSAFEGCSMLTSIIIPDGVKYINPRTFSNCKSLKTIVIGNGVVTIDTYAFNQCKSLTDIYYTGTAEQWKHIAITAWGNEILHDSDVIKHYEYVVGE